MAWMSSPGFGDKRARRLDLPAWQAQDKDQQQQRQRQLVGEDLGQAIADGLGFNIQMRVRGDVPLRGVRMPGVRFVGVDAGVLEVQLHRVLGRAAVELQMTVVMQAQDLREQQHRDDEERGENCAWRRAMHGSERSRPDRLAAGGGTHVHAIRAQSGDSRMIHRLPTTCTAISKPCTPISSMAGTSA